MARAVTVGERVLKRAREVNVSVPGSLEAMQSKQMIETVCSNFIVSDKLSIQIKAISNFTSHCIF